LPQKEQYSVLFESPLAALVIDLSHSLGDPGDPTPPQGALTPINAEYVPRVV
jgi:hypothetical protein